MAKVTRKQLAAAIAELMRTKPLERVAKEVAAYLAAERRTKELDSLMRDVMQYRAQYEGVIEADAYSAYPLSSQVKAEIKRILDADKLVLNEIIDKNVIGGVRVESSDTQLDLTVRSRLERLKASRTA